MILVVDDDKMLTEMLQSALEKKEYRVEIAYDGVEAMEHLKDPRCKLMLLDINMPRINGAELLILMNSEGIEIPTIVMASFPDYTEEEMKSFPAVKAFLPKPFTIEQLSETVDKVVEESQENT